MRGSHATLRNLKFYLLPDSSTSIVFRTRAIVSVVYSIVFSANPVKPYESCVAPQNANKRKFPTLVTKVIAMHNFLSSIHSIYI